MLMVETIVRIRRAYFIQGKPIKAICREFNISRKVVRKVLRSGETAFDYERTVQPMPKIGPYKDELDRILAGNEIKAACERLTLIRVFEELRGLGYDGGYDAVRRYAHSWRRDQVSSSAAAFVPLSFALGDLSVRLEPRCGADQWHHGDGQGGHGRLCHSRMLFVRAYPRETQEMVFDAHGWASPSSRAPARAASRTT